MIDYAKLEQVHNLYPQGYLKVIPIFDNDGRLERFDYSMPIEGCMADYFSCLDELIKAIKIHTKPKYSPGDKVFCLAMDGEFHECEILQQCDSGELQYMVQFSDTYRAFFDESRLFPTKEQLFNAQIDYWTDLKIKEISTRSDDVSMKPPFEGRVLGFNDCSRCGKQMADVPDNCKCADKLIECNTEYFRKLKDHSKEVLEKVCEHLHDGVRYALPFAQGIGYKCTVCGEFYDE